MWIKLEVYNGDSFLGSIYTNETTESGIKRDIDEEFKDWTKYNIGN
jgi:hypothetical protein